METTTTHSVTASFDIPMTTRDGIELATDIFRPADPETGEPIEEPKPALLSRTPYGKRGQWERHGEWFAKRGYVVAIQDCRGRFASEGEYSMFVNEAEDGADAVEWLAERRYCDGRVGTVGGAAIQSALATQDPPPLEAMFVNQGPANGWHETFRHHGAFELRWLCWGFVNGVAFAPEAINDKALEAMFAEIDTRDLLLDGPIFPGQTPLRHLPKYEEWILEMATVGDETAGPWFSPGINFEAHYDEMADCPTVFSGGWYDSYTKGTCDNFMALADRKSSDYYLLMGPWTHGWDRYPYVAWNKQYAGDVEFTEDSMRPFQSTRLRFFDHYLKGEDTWSDQPTVEYYKMGTSDGHPRGDRLFHGGTWEQAETWPLQATDQLPLYLHEDGSLSTEAPSAEESATSYEFDPTDPVPTIGGNVSSFLSFERSDQPVDEYPLSRRDTVEFVPGGGFDQRTTPATFGASPPYGPLESRDDVLVFRTDPLEEAVDVVGPVSVRLYVSTDAVDTDFTAKLIDEYPPSEVHPKGYALNITDSIVRARYRNGRSTADLIEPGEVYEIEFDLYPTANQFKPGHSIRVDISSSNFPRFDVNHNTGGPLYCDREYEVSTNTIYHESNHPSCILLSVE